MCTVLTVSYPEPTSRGVEHEKARNETDFEDILMGDSASRTIRGDMSKKGKRRRVVKTYTYIGTFRRGQATQCAGQDYIYPLIRNEEGLKECN
jgi:hypothetical protein